MIYSKNNWKSENETFYLTQLMFLAVKSIVPIFLKIMPTIPITPDASTVHGFKVNNGQLFHHSKRISDTLHPIDALVSFVEFLKLQLRKGCYENLILVSIIFINAQIFLVDFLEKFAFIL